MLKIVQPLADAFHNFKCGEIFCISPSVYNVTCCLCATKMHLEQFPSHFQIQHLTLAEESINLEELKRKRNAKLAKDVNLMDNIAIKEEDPVDDPIKEEEIDEDDKSLQQLIRESENEELQKDQQEETIERDNIDKNVGEKVEIKIVVRKPNTRNSKKLLANAVCIQQEQKMEEPLATVDESENNLKEYTGKEIVSTKEEEELKDEEDDMDMDRDWSVEDKLSETDVSFCIRVLYKALN